LSGLRRRANAPRDQHAPLIVEQHDADVRPIGRIVRNDRLIDQRFSLYSVRSSTTVSLIAFE